MPSGGRLLDEMIAVLDSIGHPCEGDRRAGCREDSATCLSGGRMITVIRAARRTSECSSVLCWAHAQLVAELLPNANSKRNRLAVHRIEEWLRSSNCRAGG
jgi:hypothetical protein